MPVPTRQITEEPLNTLSSLPEEKTPTSVNPDLLETSGKIKSFTMNLSRAVNQREAYMTRTVESYQRQLQKEEAYLLSLSNLKKEISLLEISYFQNGTLSDEMKKEVAKLKEKNSSLFSSFPESFTTKDQESWKESISQEIESVRSSIHSVLTLDLPKEIRNHQSIIDTAKRIFDLLDRVIQTATRVPR